MTEISWHDFDKIELQVGTIVSAEPFAEARQPAYKLRVDFGPTTGVLKSSAQITDLYTVDDLVGKQVLGVVNFPPKQIGPFMSECLVTGFVNAAGEVVLAVPDRAVDNASLPASISSLRTCCHGRWTASRCCWTSICSCRRHILSTKSQGRRRRPAYARQ